MSTRLSHTNPKYESYGGAEMKRLYSILLVVGSVVLIGFFMIALLVDYAVFSMVGFIGIAIMMLALHFSDKR